MFENIWNDLEKCELNLQKILNALSRASLGRTSICIAHRLSTVTDADRILVLDKGKIVEEGDHLSLVNNERSLYSALWRKQHEADRELLKTKLQTKNGNQ